MVRHIIQEDKETARKRWLEELAEQVKAKEVSKHENRRERYRTTSTVTAQDPMATTTAPFVPVGEISESDTAPSFRTAKRRTLSAIRRFEHQQQEVERQEREERMTRILKRDPRRPQQKEKDPSNATIGEMHVHHQEAESPAPHPNSHSRITQVYDDPETQRKKEAKMKEWRSYLESQIAEKKQRQLRERMREEEEDQRRHARDLIANRQRSESEHRQLQTQTHLQPTSERKGGTFPEISAITPTIQRDESNLIYQSKIPRPKYLLHIKTTGTELAPKPPSEGPKQPRHHPAVSQRQKRIKPPASQPLIPFPAGSKVRQGPNPAKPNKTPLPPIPIAPSTVPSVASMDKLMQPVPPSKSPPKAVAPRKIHIDEHGPAYEKKYLVRGEIPKTGALQQLSRDELSKKNKSPAPYRTQNHGPKNTKNNNAEKQLMHKQIQEMQSVLQQEKAKIGRELKGI